MSHRFIAVFTVLLMVCVGGIGFSGQNVTADRGKLRVGVYDSRAVAIAYVRHNSDAEQLKKLSTDLRAAEARNDKNTAADIRAQGERLQTLRHLQGFSNAPVDDIMKSLADRLPAIAQEANVAMIAPTVDFRDDSIEIVDVTDKLVAEFSPDERTKKILAEVKSVKPLPMIEALAIKPNE
jgi:hypothetical protein